MECGLSASFAFAGVCSAKVIKQVVGLEYLDYGERFRVLGLFLFHGRLLRSGLIKCLKASNSIDDVGLLSIFELAPETVTRGHPFMLECLLAQLSRDIDFSA